MNETFSALATSGMIFSAVLGFGLPIAAAVFLRVKYGAKWLALFVGALAFILFVYFIEGGLHYMALPALMSALGGDSDGYRAAYVVYGCLAAGLVEETARLFCLRFVLKEPALPDALMYGAGHGGAEAVLLAGMNSFGLWSLAASVNAYGVAETVGLLSADSPESAGVITGQINAMLSMNGLDFFASGLERAIAMALHMALSILIFAGVRSGSAARFWIIAAGLHALGNVPAALYQVGWLPSLWLTEALTAALVAGVALLVRSMYKSTGLAGLSGRPARDFAPRLRG